MLGISLAMLIGSALLMLRLSPGGSFPSPLSQEEEKKYLTQWQNGDISSRNVLVEHNLRLVAHSLPHNGAVVTLLNTCGVDHKDGYLPIGVMTVAMPLITLAFMIILLSIGFVA